MGLYKISLKKSVDKDLRKIDKKEIPKVLQVIESLEQDPFPIGSRKLVGSNYTYRVRVGDYRVVYFVASQAKEIVIQRVAHRKEVYD